MINNWMTPLVKAMMNAFGQEANWYVIVTPSGAVKACVIVDNTKFQRTWTWSYLDRLSVFADTVLTRDVDALYRTVQNSDAIEGTAEEL